MSNWLNKPYPQLEGSYFKTALSFGIGVSSFLFLTTFQPFGLDQVDNISYFAGFGLNAMISLLVHYFLMPRLIPRLFNPETWTTKHEMLFFVSTLLLISLLNWTYNSTVGKDISPQYSLPYFVFMTSAVGVMPVFMIIWVNEISARQRNERIAESIETIATTKEIPQKATITIVSDNASEVNLSMDLDDFLYAESSNNYCAIHYLTEGELSKQLLRLSMKNLNAQLEEHEAIVRCHKSYIVNLEKITRTEGNARSLHLYMDESEVAIPVSRTFDRSTLPV